MNEQLKKYIPVVEFLGKALGPAYEIVLQNVAGEGRIVAIANGSVSGRKIGSPLTDLALQFLNEKTYASIPFKTNYAGIGHGGRPLSSSTYFIKDSSGSIIGMLCINFDKSKVVHLKEQVERLQTSVGELAKAIEPETKESPELVENVSAPLHDLITRIASTVGNCDPSIPLNRYSSEEKLQVVHVLKNKGVFRIKGGVSETANILDVSEATIYRYIKHCQMQDEEK